MCYSCCKSCIPIFFILLIMSSITIFLSVYFSTYESTECQLIDIRSSTCYKIETSRYTYYTYIINCDVSIDDVTIDNIKGTCQDNDQLCTNCKLELILHKTYSCWKLSSTLMY